MRKTLFDLEDGDFIYKVSDHMAMDSDGNRMMRVSDNMAMELDSGELHFTSSWRDDEEDD